ncbi:MAG TPA: polysaccharide biosynthesis/export family protein [Gemmatimonadales bacterium]|jgi:polysaccharide export outer membrane protein|nr:polysaccharide biosynthesis/export family protein [Gemmatimonadales bacterium]
MRYLSLLSLASAMMLGARSLSAQTVPAAADQMTLSPGDSVRIVVWRKPEFSGDFVISPDGTVSHPLFRDVKIAGVPLATAEANLRRYLSQYDQNPQFVMEPLLHLSVSGEVPRPLVFATQPGTSVAEAVARAGGTTQFANRSHIRVIRNEPSGNQRVFYANLQDPEDRLAQSPVRSGDQIVVDRKKSFVKDIFLPTLGLIGSVASVGLLIDRINR